MIDLKTLYEQTTMYCTLLHECDVNKYHIEIYQQNDTPIYIRVVLERNFNSTVIHKISFSVRKENKI